MILWNAHGPGIAHGPENYGSNLPYGKYLHAKPRVKPYKLGPVAQHISS